MPVTIWNQSLGQWVPFQPPDVPEPPTPVGWPDASNTGFLGDPESLTSINGSTISTPGTVIQNRRITDAIRPNASDIIIRNCIINAGWFGIEATGAAVRLLVEDCTIIGGANCGIAIPSSISGVTIRRCNVSGGADGMKIGGTSVLIADNYIHDLLVVGESHNDGIQCSSGTGMIFRHNWIESPDTSCIAMFQGQGSWNNVQVDRNHLSGGGYPLYAPGSSGTYIRVTDNEFGSWGFGPVSDWDPSGLGNVWSGNIRASNGAPLNP